MKKSLNDKAARKAAGKNMRPGAMPPSSAKLEIMTPYGDRIIIFPGAERRGECYGWIVAFLESLNLKATVPSPFREPEAKPASRKGKVAK